MRPLIGLLLATTPLAAAAQTVAVSPAPDKVTVSVYRDPHRRSGPISRYWPSGFALITEQRTIDIPAGETVIRFEGVADSILAESAIVTGLPGGVAQKNRDAAVLSPAALIDFAIGRRVWVKRTDTATGAVREEEAVVRAGPGGGVVVETAAGVEALRCSGLPEALIFDKVPEGLSDKPVLSVLTRADQPVRTTVTLSYLAAGFDWGATYIARLAPDGRSMDLFAWATLANGTGRSFVEADTNTIAGRLNRRSANSSPAPQVPVLQLGCWPMGTTSDIPESELDEYGPPPPVPPPPPPAPMAPPPPAMLVVTGSRIMAQQEELGDLKLYRIPEPVTVAAKSQKQVAMIDRKNVPIERLLRYRISAYESVEAAVAPRIIRVDNEQRNNLGLALPAGSVEIFQLGGDRPMLAGRSNLRDLAVGEEVEIATGTGIDVRLDNVPLSVDASGTKVRYRTEVSNASDQPQLIEVQLFELTDAQLVEPSEKLGRKDGMPLWKATVPAGGKASLEYTLLLRR